MRTKFWEIIALLILISSSLLAVYPVLFGEQLFLPKAEKDLKVIRIYARAVELGGFVPKEIVVNQGDRVKLLIFAQDVVHGFAIREYGIDVKLKPGEWTEVEFTADKSGTFTFFCSIYCSPLHVAMRGKLIVLPKK